MNLKKSIATAIILIAGLLLSEAGNCQEQVVLKAHTKNTMHYGAIVKDKLDQAKPVVRFIVPLLLEKMNSIFPSERNDNPREEDILDFNFNMDDLIADKVTEEDATIIYTQESMRMEAQKDTTNVIMWLRFDPGGTKLTMTIKVGDMRPMTMNVPKGNTVSSTSQNQMAPAGVASEELIGYQVDKYIFSSESDLDLLPSNINSNSGYDSSGSKIKRKDYGEAWLAPGVPGIGIISGFYTNLTLGGYNLSGAENGGILSIIDRLLNIGLPLKTTEVTTFYPNDTISSNKYYVQNSTVTTIKGIWTVPYENKLFDPPVSGGKEKAAPGNNEYSMPNDKPGQCDCSCEKYAEYMAISKMSKKEKKHMDMGNFSQDDMKCIKECLPVWIKNCVQIKQ
ncbi:MAG: hypothetical protein GC171_03820 [Terrimonas sp.]|nr:hypothetical protein [Terrimonas sp.]